MLFLIFAGIISLVFGILLLVAPQVIQDLSDKFNNLVSIDEKVYSLRFGIGISFLLIFILISFVFYYMVKVHGA